MSATAIGNTEALVGQNVIHVRNALTGQRTHWRVQADGVWVGPQGERMAPNDFLLDIEAGNVFAGKHLTVGQVWAQAEQYGYAYVILRNPWPRDPETGRPERVLTARVWLPEGIFQGVQSLRVDQVPALQLSNADWLPNVTAMGEAIAARDEITERLGNQIRELETASRESSNDALDLYRGSVREALHTFIEQHDEADEDDLLGLCDSLGVGRPRVTTTVDVCVTGIIEVTVAPSDIDRLLPAGVNPGSGSNGVDFWTPFHTDLHMPFEGAAGECVCNQVTLDLVLAELTERGVRGCRDVEVTSTECENC